MTKQRAVSILLGGLALVTVGVAAFTMYRQRTPGSGARRVMPGEEVSRTPGISIRRVLNGGGSDSRISTTVFESRGVTIDEVVKNAFAVPRGGLRVEAPFPEGYYDIVVSEMPGSSQTPSQRLATALAEAFGLRIITERRLVEALRMRCDPHAGTPFPAIASVRIAETDYSSEWNTLRLIGTWDDLAAKLTEMMAIPVVAPPGKAGNFDFTLGWNPRDPDSLTRCLAARGVTLEPGVEDLDVLVVRAR